MLDEGGKLPVVLKNIPVEAGRVMTAVTRQSSKSGLCLGPTLIAPRNNSGIPPLTQTGLPACVRRIYKMIKTCIRVWLVYGSGHV